VFKNVRRACLNHIYSDLSLHRLQTDLLQQCETGKNKLDPQFASVYMVSSTVQYSDLFSLRAVNLCDQNHFSEMQNINAPPHQLDKTLNVSEALLHLHLPRDVSV